jgi:hypothetical protein
MILLYGLNVIPYEYEFTMKRKKIGQDGRRLSLEIGSVDGFFYKRIRIRSGIVACEGVPRAFHRY